MNTITSCYLPAQTESKAEIPDGKIEGVFVVDDTLNIAVLHEIGASRRVVEFHVICEPTKMKSIDSLGKYYGSFILKGYYHHVYKKLY